VDIPSGAPNLLNGLKAKDITVRGYTLRDDELASFLAVGHDLEMLIRLLEQVYVHVEGHFGDALNPNTSQPWTRTATSAVIANPRDMASSKPFWAVPLILAFEGIDTDSNLTPRDNERRDTHDPSNYSVTEKGKTTYFSGLLGVTYPGPGGNLTQPRSLSFIETIRDFKETNTTPARATVSLAEMYASNAAHEVLHSLTLGHSGGIMCARRKNNATDPMRFSLADEQLSDLRDIEQPEWPTKPNLKCGQGGATPPNCCP